MEHFEQNDKDLPIPTAQYESVSKYERDDKHRSRDRKSSRDPERRHRRSSREGEDRRRDRERESSRREGDDRRSSRRERSRDVESSSRRKSSRDRESRSRRRSSRDRESRAERGDGRRERGDDRRSRRDEEQGESRQRVHTEFPVEDEFGEKQPFRPREIISFDSQARQSKQFNDSRSGYQDRQPLSSDRRQDSGLDSRLGSRSEVPSARPNNVFQERERMYQDRQVYDREREARSSRDTREQRDSWKIDRNPAPPAQTAPVVQRRVPPPMIRERNTPLPPLVLSEIVPMHLRKSKLSNWDAAPPGYDGMSVVQVKMTGHFPAPGLASRSLIQMTALPAHLLPGYTLPNGEAPSSASIAQYYKQARRMYVEGLPKGCTNKMVLDFFNDTMKDLYMAIESGNPATSAEVDTENGFAFVEFRTPEEATSAISLDGIKWRGTNVRLHTKRPKEYISPDGSAESPHKITVQGIPTILAQDQIAELFAAFGELKFFNLAFDPETKLSVGDAVCEYEDPAITDVACQSLNGMELGSDKLIVQRSNLATKSSKSKAKPTIAKPLPPGAHSTACVVHVIPPHKLEVDDVIEGATRVVMLLNMLDPEDINDVDEGFIEEITSEFARYGVVLSVRIPKPPRTETGKVFVEYETSEMATKALNALAGRLFLLRTLAACYYDEEKYGMLQEE